MSNIERPYLFGHPCDGESESDNQFKEAAEAVTVIRKSSSCGCAITSCTCGYQDAIKTLDNFFKNKKGIYNE